MFMHPSVDSVVGQGIEHEFSTIVGRICKGDQSNLPYRTRSLPTFNLKRKPRNAKKLVVNFLRKRCPQPGESPHNTGGAEQQAHVAQSAAEIPMVPHTLTPSYRAVGLVFSALEPRVLFIQEANQPSHVEWRLWEELPTILPCLRKSLQNGGPQSRLPTTRITHIGRCLISLLERIHCISLYGEMDLKDIFCLEVEDGLYLGLRESQSLFAKTQRDTASYRRDMQSLGFILLFLFGVSPWSISKTRGIKYVRDRFLAEPRAFLLGHDAVHLEDPADADPLRQGDQDWSLPTRPVSQWIHNREQMVEFFNLIGDMNGKPDYQRFRSVLDKIDHKFHEALL
ncbi:hypothetical protein N7513_003214 [Penicillium frequentans]|nr:hypothetical protein N7513_003214 [Penicillium glabrum]